MLVRASDAYLTLRWHIWWGPLLPIFCTIKCMGVLTRKTTVQIGEILEPIGKIDSRNQGLMQVIRCCRKLPHLVWLMKFLNM